MTSGGKRKPAKADRVAGAGRGRRVLIPAVSPPGSDRADATVPCKHLSGGPAGYRPSGAPGPLGQRRAGGHHLGGLLPTTDDQRQAKVEGYPDEQPHGIPAERVRLAWIEQRGHRWRVPVPEARRCCRTFAGRQALLAPLDGTRWPGEPDLVQVEQTAICHRSLLAAVKAFRWPLPAG